MLPTLLIIVLATVVLHGTYIPKIFNIELQDVGKNYKNNYFAKQIISNGIAGDPVKEKEKKGRSAKFNSKKHEAGEKESNAKEKEDGKGEEQEWGTAVSALASEAAKKAAVAAAKEICKAAAAAVDPNEKEGREERERLKISYNEQVRKMMKRWAKDTVLWLKWTKTHLKGMSKVAKKETLHAARAACKSMGAKM